jgi:hypothetical protein
MNWLTRIGIIGAFGFALIGKVSAQTDEVQQLLLNVEKLDQLREMLDNMRDKYQILTQGYNQVRNVAEGNFTLHEAFLNRLVQVNPKVRTYYKVGEIIRMQSQFLEGIVQAKREFRLGNFLEEREMQQVERMFGQLSSSSLSLLEELMLILSDSQLQMNDFERIQAIDRVHGSTMELGKGVRRFSNSLGQLSEIRKSKLAEFKTLENLINHE